MIYCLSSTFHSFPTISLSNQINLRSQHDSSSQKGKLSGLKLSRSCAIMCQSNPKISPPWSHLLAKWLWSYFSSSAICLYCTSCLYPLCQCERDRYLYIYYLDSYSQIYRDGTLWSNLALTGGNSRHRKRLRKKRCEVDLPWRMVFPGISQMFNYDDVGSCDCNILHLFLWWSILIVHGCVASSCIGLFLSSKLLKPCTSGISVDIPLAFRFNVNVHCTWKNCT